jgi:WD40 repeat protein
MQVNDLALSGEVLISCSNDRTLRVWQADSPGQHSMHSTKGADGFPWLLFALQRWAGVALAPCYALAGAQKLGTACFAAACTGRCPMPTLICSWLTPAPRFPLPPLADAALGCLRGHSDYVTCLAAASGGTTLASGGLRGEVLLWDLAALRAVIAGGAQVRGSEAGNAALRSAELGPELPACCLQETGHAGGSCGGHA